MSGNLRKITPFTYTFVSTWPVYSACKLCRGLMVSSVHITDPCTTVDTDVLLDEIRSLSAFGGGDTPEPSVGALIRAVEASVRQSPIYV